MIADIYKEWFNNISKLTLRYEATLLKYEKSETDNMESEQLYNIRMNLYKNARKLYLYIIETKPTYFSIQPKYLSFWKTINKKRYDLLDDIENKLKTVNNKEERRYLMIYKTTLKRYDSTYGLSIGLALHRKFNQDIALLIYEYMM